jgi:hypothetical protein
MCVNCQVWPVDSSDFSGIYWTFPSQLKMGSTDMQSIILASGDQIEARCTKCRKNTEHIIITMAEEVPVKVQCKICSREHGYRPPTTVKKTVRKSTSNSKDSERKEWEALRPGMNTARAADYSMTSAYKVNALINHPVFGFGLVQRVIGSQKVEILFEDGKKMMRCK